jgi:hypothetical protein
MIASNRDAVIRFFYGREKKRHTRRRLKGTDEGSKGLKGVRDFRISGPVAFHSKAVHSFSSEERLQKKYSLDGTWKNTIAPKYSKTWHAQVFSFYDLVFKK